MLSYPNQDDGSRGWLPTGPECKILEKFPDFLKRNGRNVMLPETVAWNCFPEGAKIWRGAKPPTAQDMNIPTRFILHASANAFDEYLHCATILTWFLCQSKSDERDSHVIKNYGVCMRFFVRAPSGIDRTQDDYAQANSIANLWMPRGSYRTNSSSSSTR